MTKVTQADRDAAAQFDASWHAYDTPLTKAFATHREAAEQGKAELVEALEKIAAGRVHGRAGAKVGSPLGKFEAQEIAAQALKKARQG